MKSEHAKYAETAGIVLVCIMISTTVLAAALRPWRDSLAVVPQLWLGIIPVHVAGFTAAWVAASKLFPEKRASEALWLGFSRSRLPSAKRFAGELTVIYTTTVALTVLTTKLLQEFGLKPQGSPVLQKITENSGPATWISLFVITVAVAPLAEEVLFRSVFFELFAPISKVLAAIVTAAFFSVIHQIPEHIPALFVLGLFLQWQRQRRKTLGAPILYHAAFNLISMILFMTSMLWATPETA